MLKKTVLVRMTLIMCLGLFAGCTDYGYEYHFSVVGENGTIVIIGIGSDLNPLIIDESPFLARGGKGRNGREFTAIPDDGFQVKEWRLNDDVITGNKSNVCKVEVTEYVNYITVEFEPIK